MGIFDLLKLPMLVLFLSGKSSSILLNPEVIKFHYEILSYIENTVALNEIKSVNIFHDNSTCNDHMDEGLISLLDLPLILDDTGPNKTGNSIFIFVSYDVELITAVLKHIDLVKFPQFLLVQFFSCTEQVDDSILFFEKLWGYNISSAKAVVEQSDLNLKVYGFSPFIENNCGNVRRIEEMKIDTWDVKRKRLLKPKQSVSNLKAINLQKCPIRAFVRNRPPDTEIKTTLNNKFIFEGSGGLLFKTAVNKFNFTPEFYFLKHEDGNIYNYKITENNNICCDSLHNRSQDVIVGMFANVMYPQQTVELTIPIVQECFTFNAPCEFGQSSKPVVGFYLKAFPRRIWLLMIISMFFVVVLMSIINIFVPFENIVFNSPLTNTFYLFGSLLSIAIPRNPQSNAMRSLFIYTLFPFLILRAAFEANLKSLRSTLNTDTSNIMNLDEIKDLNVKIVSTPQSLQVGGGIIQGISGTLIQKFDPVKNGYFGDMIDRLVLHRDCILFGPERISAVYINNAHTKRMKLNNGTVSVCTVKPCPVNVYSTTFIFRKGSILIEPFNDIIQRLLQSGILQRWWMMRDPGNKKRYRASTVTFKEIAKQLYIFLFGISLSIVICMLEIMYFNLRKNGNTKPIETC